MNISAFKTIRTQKELRNTISLIHGIADEHGTNVGNLLKVVGTEFEDLTYTISTCRAGFIHTNWFTSREESGVGLVKAMACSDKLIKVTDAVYSQFITFHQNCWLGVCADTTYDLLLFDKVVLRNILSYDVLQLSDYLVFVQLDTEDARYLICCNAIDLNKGIFIPTSIENFQDWFYNQVGQLGYSGKLDDYPISSLIQLYYEVQNCIFQNGNYVALEVENL